ncbi:MAG: hypothetical protein SGI89_13330 [bacterium]|nr:hypothetical protein [bacterium]
MKKFLLKCFLVLLPVVILLTGFFIFDPFKIVYSYKDFYEDYIIFLNRDYVSTEMYINNSEKNKYDSFIFGSSRTIAYKTQSWKKYLDSSAKPFLYDASAEQVDGIYLKIKFLEKTGSPIRNAIIIICRDCSFAKYDPESGHLFVKHPEISGKSYFSFYKPFIKDYFNFNFLRSYYDYRLNHKVKNFMWGIIDPKQLVVDPVTNDLFPVNIENEIKTDSVKFFAGIASQFYHRGNNIPLSEPAISETHIEMLKEIERIFKEKNTDYKIIISPLYEQKKFAEKDMQILDNIFGAEHVYDFSGVNEFTDDYHNYYEASHYRISVGDEILKRIYQKTN